MLDDKKIGLFIRSLRNEKNYTQEELSEKIDVTCRTISSWENGTRIPRKKQLEKLAEFFGVTSIEILKGERETRSVPQTLPTSENKNHVMDGRIQNYENQPILNQESSDKKLEFREGRGLVARSFGCVAVVLVWGFISANTSICKGVNQDRFLYYPCLCFFAIAYGLLLSRDFYSKNDIKARKIALTGTIVFGALSFVWLLGVTYMRVNLGIN